MKNYLLLFTLILLGSASIQSQIIFQEDFEGGSLPTGWGIETNASDGGWIIGSPSGLSSQYWTIEDNGSTGIAATNDDQCNCNKNRDYIITPSIDFTGLTGVALNVDVFFGEGSYQGATENASIEISIDGGTTWSKIEDLHGNAGWVTYKVNLSAYAGQADVMLRFLYSDGGGWVFGLAIDNVVIEVPPTLDVELTKLKSRAFGLENTAVPISGVIYNHGLTTITTLELAYTVNGEKADTATLEGLNVEAFQSFEFTHPVSWTPETEGGYEVVVEILAVNEVGDEDTTNNLLSFTTEIYPEIIRPNRIADFLAGEPVSTTMATAANNLDKPNDLDFFPILAKNELWVVNERIENSGGSTVTMYNPGTPAESFLFREDGNAWHFMSLPTAISFSDNFNFGTSPGVQDANHSGGTFTGPTLWSSDPEIYAQPSGGNGSHLDMLHGSPYSMGIESEGDNVFWVFDGWNETIVRYDFKEDHGPGNDDHDDGVVRRYMEIKVKKDGDVPSHMVLDKTTGWLYVVDNGNNRVLRLDIHSGNVTNPLPLINETLAEHSQMGNVTWEVIINTGLDRPCGIDLIDNRLLVGDYATGEIIVYDVNNNFAELGRLATGNQGLTGIKVGPDGAIWYTNRLENTVTMMLPGEVTSTEEDIYAAQVRIMPNPTSGMLSVTLPGLSDFTQTNLELKDLSGKTMLAREHVSGTQQLNIAHLPEGIYMLKVSTGKQHIVRKIVLQK